MTLNEVRRMALSLPEATEEPHFHYTSFRIRGKIFATALPDGEYLHLFVTDCQRDAALAGEPDFLEELRWGDQVNGLRVLLPTAKPDVVSKLLAPGLGGEGSQAPAGVGARKRLTDSATPPARGRGWVCPS